MSSPTRVDLMPRGSFLPSSEALSAGLSRRLNGRGSARGRVDVEVEVIKRETSHEGTFPKELVTCRLGDGSTRTLFCKYGIDADNAAHGHRGGVVYEARVYRMLLRNS